MFVNGDNRKALKALDDDSIDAIVCDPPYGLEFMGKDWDHGVPGVEFWAAALRVAKPGAHMLAFGGTRTHHRLMCAIEDAGWEIRDTIMWVYGTGFPKSLDVSKAIDKAAGAEREVIGERRWHGRDPNGTALGRMNDDAWQAKGDENIRETAPATDAAKQWDGWGTALKPAWEPIIVARKPLQGTVANNVLTHGTGAINVDACRVPSEERPPVTGFANRNLLKRRAQANNRPWMIAADADESGAVQPHAVGRFPANLIHDGSDEVLAGFPETEGQIGGNNDPNGSMGYHGGATGRSNPGTSDFGSAARFFYCAKASKSDRGKGNGHPTVKPHELMRYLVRLVCPPGGIVLDQFMGSGSTGKAAVAEGMRFIGIDDDTEHGYFNIAYKRIEKEWYEHKNSFALFLKK